jgi:hypothetical protein
MIAAVLPFLIPDPQLHDGMLDLSGLCQPAPFKEMAGKGFSGSESRPSILFRIQARHRSGYQPGCFSAIE